MTLGKCINSYRIKNDMTMDAFAQKAHLTKAYISMLENGNKNRGGKRPAPSIETYKKCALAMDISFDDLLKIVDDLISIKPTESNFHSQFDKMSSDNDEYHISGRADLISALNELTDEQLDEMFMKLIAGKDKDYLLRLAAKILEMASQK